MNILDEIIANKKVEVRNKKTEVAIYELESSKFFQREILNVKDYMLDTSLSGIIAEVKKKSPSKGIINDQVEVDEVAIGYEEAGVSCVSVLTDWKYFGGKNEFLTKVRETISIPILRKDFIVDEYQLIEAKSIGADMILLIAAGLKVKELKQLAKTAKELGLNILMEVHSKEELDSYLCDELDLVGVNNRNLKTMEVSVETSKELLKFIPDQFVKISESGISNTETINELKYLGYQGFLIGENFMKEANPGQACKDFISQLK